jgi:hypothetical protein
VIPLILAIPHQNRKITVTFMICEHNV